MSMYYMYLIISQISHNHTFSIFFKIDKWRMEFRKMTQSESSCECIYKCICTLDDPFPVWNEWVCLWETHIHLHRQQIISTFLSFDAKKKKIKRKERRRSLLTINRGRNVQLNKWKMNWNRRGCWRNHVLVRNAPNSAHISSMCVHTEHIVR